MIKFDFDSNLLLDVFMQAQLFLLIILDRSFKMLVDLEFIHNFFQVYVCECLDMKKVCLRAFCRWKARFLGQDDWEQMLIVQFQRDSFLGFY